MWDIAEGTSVLLALSGGLFWYGLKVAHCRTRKVSGCVALGGTVLLLVFALVIHGTLVLAQLLPFSNAIILGNWIPPGAALLAGILAGQRTIPPWRRVAFASLLVSLGWYTILCNFLGPAPPSQHFWSEAGLSLQARNASCGACCVVTLLWDCGIEADEREMMSLCLTRRHGTPLLGVYRGLKLKTRDTEWDVAVVRGSIEELRRTASRPILLPIRLERSRVRGPIPPSHKLGPWLQRRNHTVVLYGFTENGQVEIGDPAVGHVIWTVDDLKQQWCGEGLQLVKRGTSK